MDTIPRNCHRSSIFSVTLSDPNDEEVVTIGTEEEEEEEETVV